MVTVKDAWPSERKYCNSAGFRNVMVLGAESATVVELQVTGICAVRNVLDDLLNPSPLSRRRFGSSPRFSCRPRQQPLFNRKRLFNFLQSVTSIS